MANKVNLKEKAKAVVKTAQEAKELISTLSTPLGIFQLLKYIDFLKDGTYISALGVAVFDDTIDFTGLTDAAPVILGFIMGICTESYMSGMYFLGSYIEGGEMSQIQRQFIRRSIAMILGIIVEAIPVVDIIPSETLIGVVIFAFVLAERKRKADKEKAAAGVATS